MVEHHGVENFASRLGQSERDVGDAKDRLATRQRLFDQPNAFDRLDARADIILVAGADREDERIEDDVLGLDAVFFGEQLERALGHLQLALARDGLRLLLVIVDASDDQRGAEAARERHDFLEAILAVFEVDRIDQRLARRALERLFDHAMIGRIDHQRHFDFFDFDFEEARDVGHLVAIRVLQAYVEDVRTATDLHAPNFGGLLDLAVRDQPLELAAAKHVGPLADDHRTRIVVDDERFDSGNHRAPQRRSFARTLASHRLHQQPDVLRRRAAASADQVDPSILGEARNFPGEHRGRLIVMPLFVGQTRIRHACDKKFRDAGQSAQMIGHEVGAGRAVEAHPEQIAMRERGVERLDVLPAEESAHCLDRSRHRDGRRDAELRDRGLDGDQTGLAVERVVDGFEQQDIGAALDQPFGLHLVTIAHLFEGDAAGDRDALGRRAHRTRDEARLVRGAESSGFLARENRSETVDLSRVLFEIVLGEHDRARLKARSLNYIRAHFEKAVVHPANQLRPRAHDVLVASFVSSATVICGAQIFAEHKGAESPVQNEDSFSEQLLEELDPVRIGGHCWMPVRMRAVTN